MPPRPLLLFVAALALACAGIAAGITLFKDARAESTRDRLEAEAHALAHRAVVWSRTPTVLGGGEGTRALRGLRLQALGVTPRTDAEGEHVVSALATLRFHDLDTDVPAVEARALGGLASVRLAIHGPDAACVVPADEPLGAARPDGCPAW